MRFRSLFVWPWITAALFLASVAAAQSSADPPKTNNETTPPASEKSDPSQDTAKDTTEDSTPAPGAKGKGKSSKKAKTAKTKAEQIGDAKAKTKTEKATFGGGCFWSIEAIFERIPGVKSVVSGFSGGTVASPDYEMVCSGETGHAEVVRILYDPDTITYEDLLDVFWSAHDPTTLNSQGEDFGTQYRSVIFYHTEDQMRAARKSYKKLTAAGTFGRPIVTDLVPAGPFYPAEKYHQDYYRKHRTSEYCQMVIAPKLRKLKLLK